MKAEAGMERMGEKRRRPDARRRQHIKGNEMMRADETQSRGTPRRHSENIHFGTGERAYLA